MQTKSTKRKRIKKSEMILCRIPFVRMSRRLNSRILKVSSEMGISQGAAFFEIVRPYLERECA